MGTVGDFVPRDFTPPTALDHPSFRLRPLGPQHNERDHAAWMGSIDHVRSTPGFPNRGWPEPMSLADNLGDLEAHALDFEARTGFTFTVLAPEGPVETADVIGCLYLYPHPDDTVDVDVRSWVRADHADLDAPLAAALRAWLESDAWPWQPEGILDRPR